VGFVDGCDEGNLVGCIVGRDVGLRVGELEG
jgi:hypothetical protein